MEYVVAFLMLAAAPFVFVGFYASRVNRFKGPWIIEEPVAVRTSGLVFETKDGQRQLVGLSKEETSEFEQLDRLSPVDTSGQAIAWEFPAAQPTTRETRWLELYLKHQQALKRRTHARVAFPGSISRPAA